MSCAAYAEWEAVHDPQVAVIQLERHLKEAGIQCPSCGFHYDLAKGGCMHFHCIQCGHDFCGGCKLPFKIGDKCGVNEYCAKLGLHAHHPRNCLFYLRDKEPSQLKVLLDVSLDLLNHLNHGLDSISLQLHGVEYKKKDESGSKLKYCQIMEQKRTGSGFRDDPCSRLVEYSGLCR